ncbi:hypothetical protein LguiA_013612 [Lonicera macranthoides]
MGSSIINQREGRFTLYLAYFTCTCMGSSISEVAKDYTSMEIQWKCNFSKFFFGLPITQSWNKTIWAFILNLLLYTLQFGLLS